MWFKRKTKNRRFERPALLNVKLRSSQTRAARFRLAGLGLTVAFSLVLILFVLWRGGEWALDRLVYENDAFAIRQIEVQTGGVIAPENFRRWAMVKNGQNLLSLDLMRVKRDLELVPFVQSAAVERVLPRTLRLRIIEREPIAQVITAQRDAQGNFEQVVYQLDENGFVMKPLDPRLRAAPPAHTNEIFPIISGLNTSELRPGRRAESPQVLAALQLISEFGYSPMAGLAEIERINVSTPEILEAFTSHGSQIVFSLNSFETQLRRWRLVYDQCQKNGKAIAQLDLSIANNVPLRFVEAVPLPPVRAKVVKPPHKKKNV
ncbi:MAG: FtsQ-type POTRA domain-containing protein [Verrucomicrobiota bacterium]